MKKIILINFIACRKFVWHNNKVLILTYMLSSIWKYKILYITWYKIFLSFFSFMLFLIFYFVFLQDFIFFENIYIYYFFFLKLSVYDVKDSTYKIIIIK